MYNPLKYEIFHEFDIIWSYDEYHLKYSDLVEGSRRVMFTLASGTNYVSTTLDIYPSHNGFRFQCHRTKMYIREAFSFLIWLILRAIESHVVMNMKLCDPKAFILWHDCLDHSGWTIICRNVENSHGHPRINLTENNKLGKTKKKIQWSCHFFLKLILNLNYSYKEWTYSPTQWSILFYDLDWCI